MHPRLTQNLTLADAIPEDALTNLRDIVKCCVLKTFGTRCAEVFDKAFSLAEGDPTSFDSCVAE
jgi:hypothetical protein